MSTSNPVLVRLDPCPPTAIAAVAAVAATLSLFKVVSKCTIHPVSSSDCSSVTIKLATNCSTTNDDVCDSGRVLKFTACEYDCHEIISCAV